MMRRNTEGAARIGNKRRNCQTCNRFFQRVTRLASQKLRDRHRDEWDQLRVETEIEVYRDVISRWKAEREEIQP